MGPLDSYKSHLIDVGKQEKPSSDDFVFEHGWVGNNTVTYTKVPGSLVSYNELSDKIQDWFKECTSPEEKIHLLHGVKALNEKISQVVGDKNLSTGYLSSISKSAREEAPFRALFPSKTDLPKDLLAPTKRDLPTLRAYLEKVTKAVDTFKANNYCGILKNVPRELSKSALEEARKIVVEEGLLFDQLVTYLSTLDDAKKPELKQDITNLRNQLQALENERSALSRLSSKIENEQQALPILASVVEKGLQGLSKAESEELSRQILDKNISFTAGNERPAAFQNDPFVPFPKMDKSALKPIKTYFETCPAWEQEAKENLRSLRETKTQVLQIIKDAGMQQNDVQGLSSFLKYLDSLDKKYEEDLQKDPFHELVLSYLDTQGTKYAWFHPADWKKGVPLSAVISLPPITPKPTDMEQKNRIYLLSELAEFDKAISQIFIVMYREGYQKSYIDELITYRNALNQTADHIAPALSTLRDYQEDLSKITTLITNCEPWFFDEEKSSLNSFRENILNTDYTHPFEQPGKTNMPVGEAKKRFTGFRSMYRDEYEIYPILQNELKKFEDLDTALKNLSQNLGAVTNEYILPFRKLIQVKKNTVILSYLQHRLSLYAKNALEGEFEKLLFKDSLFEIFQSVLYREENIVDAFNKFMKDASPNDIQDVVSLLDGLDKCSKGIRYSSYNNSTVKSLMESIENKCRILKEHITKNNLTADSIPYEKRIRQVPTKEKVTDLCGLVNETLKKGLFPPCQIDSIQSFIKNISEENYSQPFTKPPAPSPLGKDEVIKIYENFKKIYPANKQRIAEGFKESTIYLSLSQKNLQRLLGTLAPGDAKDYFNAFKEMIVEDFESHTISFVEFMSSLDDSYRKAMGNEKLFKIIGYLFNYKENSADKFDEINRDTPITPEEKEELRKAINAILNCSLPVDRDIPHDCSDILTLVKMRCSRLLEHLDRLRSV